MSNVIRFLEAVGSKPLSAADYVAGVSLLDIDEDQKKALRERDYDALSQSLRGRHVVRCLIFGGEEVQ